jgi:hypothetical protein
VKYGVLKIAAGVFLGIVAAFCVYKAVEAWEIHARAKRYVEQQRLEAEALQSRISEAAEKLEPSLTPDKLVVLCGPPLRDRLRGDSFRLMEYVGADGHKIELEFLCEKGERCFLFNRIRRPDATVYESNHPANYETYLLPNGHLHESRISQVEELPCLVGLPKLQ